MKAESVAKAYVLTHGVRFTAAAQKHATDVNAKRQNMVYNLPAADPGQGREPSRRTSSGKSCGDQIERPQELFLVGDDGYKVCVSTVAPVECRPAATVDFSNGRLSLCTPAQPKIGRSLAEVEYVPQPSYYNRHTGSGESVKRWVSACGYNEMNIWPWHDCAIDQCCDFCGINVLQSQTGAHADLISALKLRRSPDIMRTWESLRDAVVAEIVESVGLAIVDECYRKGIHLIIISGNLASSQLDAQARIYADIAAAITKRFPDRFERGAVAVTAPPLDLALLQVMRDSGVRVGVFNLEAFTPRGFAAHCPGKSRIGRGHYVGTLRKGVEVFGWGRSWSNFVLGLEPLDDLLRGCKELASQGITPGANVLHHDYGARGLQVPPDLQTVLRFYRELRRIYIDHKLRPYYCQLALRTSLANEAFAGRLD